MRLRKKLTSTTVMLLALSAEGAAMAQSAPARAGGANDPALVRIDQGGTWVGPELEAARASLAGTAKKGDKGASVDLNSLANRQAAAGSGDPGALALPSGAGAPIHSNGAGGDGLQMLHGDATGRTSTTAGPVTRVAAVDIQDGAASTTAPPPHAEAVIRGQVHPAVKTCYEIDPDSKSKRGARLLVAIKVTPTGDVDSVNVSSDIVVSASLASCITTAAHAVKFAAPGANGTTVRAAFVFPGQDDQASAVAAAARAKTSHPASAPVRPAHDTLAKAESSPANGETAAR